jgi:malonyl-CoA/methylmalonyl-CoA synthetase
LCPSRSGGYKISALDVERAYLSHPDILEIAILGVEDQTWGQKVAAVVVFRDTAASRVGLEEVCSENIVFLF